MFNKKKLSGKYKYRFKTFWALEPKKQMPMFDYIDEQDPKCNSTEIINPKHLDPKEVINWERFERELKDIGGFDSLYFPSEDKELA